MSISLAPCDQETKVEAYSDSDMESTITFDEYMSRYLNFIGELHDENEEEPECEPPTCEDWKKWEELEELDRVLGNKSYEAFLNHRSLKESNASEEEIAKAKEAEWIARGKSMRAYDNLVNWMEKFGFRSFDHVDEVKKSLNQV